MPSVSIIGGKLIARNGFTLFRDIASVTVDRTQKSVTINDGFLWFICSKRPQIIHFDDIVYITYWEGYIPESSDFPASTDSAVTLNLINPFRELQLFYTNSYSEDLLSNYAELLSDFTGVKLFRK